MGALEDAVISRCEDRETTGTMRRVITPASILEAAAEIGLSPRQMEIAALRQSIIPERYLRNFDAYTYDEQVRLLEGAVFQVGLGGLGGHVLEIMARAGVGHITALDGDVFETHNLNRQLLSSEEYVGRPKAEAAMERVAAINPSCNFTAHHTYLDVDADGTISDIELRIAMRRATVVVDALGGLKDRLGLQNSAAQAEVPMVTAAMAGDSGWVSTVMPGYPGPADFLGGAGADEDTLGTPVPAVALAASLQAAEILRILSGKGPALVGKMLLFDLEANSFETVTL